MNYNLLLHPEIQLTSTSNLQTEANNNQPASSIPPSGLNLSQGITGTLVDQVVQYRNREDARNGINLDKLARQRKETVLMAIASNKRYTSGLHVAAGRYLLGPEVVDDQLKRKRHAEEVQSERENKKIDAHMALAKRFYVIITLKNSLQSGQSWRKRKQWRCSVLQQASRRSSITNNEATFAYQIS